MAEVEETPYEPTTEEEEVEVEVEEEEEVFAPGSSAVEIKLFGKWSFDDIEIRDISLVVRTFLTTLHNHHSFIHVYLSIYLCCCHERSQLRFDLSSLFVLLCNTFLSTMIEKKKQFFHTNTFSLSIYPMDGLYPILYPIYYTILYTVYEL